MGEDFAKRGFRSLGVAVKEGGDSWKILGIIPMFDPPRHDTAVVRRIFLCRYSLVD